MSRRKYIKEWKGRAKGKAPRVVCPGEPAQAVIGVRLPPGATEEAIDQVRADAQALETAATLLRDAPGYPVPHTAETIEALLAMATGMRLAADRMPDSRDIPF